jgi:transmembrane sensor
MTGSKPPEGNGLGNQLYDDAAEWFARMRGPDAAAHQSEFDAWLARGALHRAAYYRVAEIFTDSGRLDNPAEVPIKEPWHRSGEAGLATVALLVSAFTTMAVLYLHSDVNVPDSAPRDARLASASSAPPIASISSGVGELRRARLADGSTVLLDTDSLISIAYTPHERRLRLIRGRVRFDVAHEARPFRVAAGEGLVTARGTIFDVRLAEGGMVKVDLIRGAVDVFTSMARTASIRRLRAGQSTIIARNAAFTPVATAQGDTDWPDGLTEFHDIPLNQLMQEANRYSVMPLVTDDPTIATLRVSGVFELRDTRRLGMRLARLFDIECKIAADRVSLRRKYVDQRNFSS